jgi:hypothetical protein
MGTTDSKNKAVPPTFILIMADNLDANRKPRTQNATLEAVVALFRAKYGEPVQILTHRDFTGVMEGIKSFAVKSLPLYHFLVKMDGTA